MSRVDPTGFRVISRSDDGVPVRCSYCARPMKHVVVLPLTKRPELEERLEASDGNELWMGLCAYCVLAMAQALSAAEAKAKAEGKSP